MKYDFSKLRSSITPRSFSVEDKVTGHHSKLKLYCKRLCG